MGSNRSGSKSTSRGYSSRSRVEDPLMDGGNPELPRQNYIDGDQLVVSLPQTWKQQQNRRGNQRRSAGGKNSRHRASSSSSRDRRGNSASYSTVIGNNLEGLVDTTENISANYHLAGNSGRPHTLVGQSGQPGSATASLRSRQSTQSG